MPEHQEQTNQEQSAHTGTSRRKLLGAALVGAAASGVAATGLTAGLGRDAGAADRPELTPTLDSPVKLAMEPTELRSGDLVITNQRDSQILLTRGEHVRKIADVRTLNNAFLWDTAVTRDHQRLYLSFAGVRTPQAGQVGVMGSGGVAEIDLRHGRLTRLFSAKKKLTDPSGLTLSPDERLLYVADYNDFGGSGRISVVDLNSGRVDVLTEGDQLREPTGINLDGATHAVVGNANMPEGGYAGGGVVRVDLRTGQQERVHEQYDPKAAPSVIGAARLPNGTVVGTRSEWPQQATSTVFAVRDVKSFDNLYHPRPGFFGGGTSVDGNALWVTESTRWEVLKIDSDGRIERRISLDPARSQNPELLIGAFDTLESVHLVA